MGSGLFVNGEIEEPSVDFGHFGRGGQVIDGFSGYDRVFENRPEQVALVPLVDPTVVHANHGAHIPGMHGVNRHACALQAVS